MQVTRRIFTLSVTAALLGGCASGLPGATALPAADPALQPVANPGWEAWVAAFRPRAEAQGIPRAVLDTAFRDAGYLPGVVERDRAQTEFTRTLEDYLAIVANPEKVATGRAMRARHSGLLGRIEARYGVPADVVTAVWGMESNYGARRGDIPVVSATSTLAYDGRRGAFFEQQLLAALRILARGDTTAPRLVGSWAGAMGHTQFIPTTYQASAVDFDGDGRRDIWAEDPTDALASAAAYLADSGWQRGQPWGYEVRAPGGLGGGRRSLSDWAAAGVTRADGGTLAGGAAARLVQPMGPGGPAFLALRNFDTILRYNNSENYAIGVGHLSDRIGGAGALRAAFPPDRYGLTIEDRKELQRRLTAAGYDAGTPDGVLGSKTEAAIRAWQAANGRAVTGTPSAELLAALR
ncbi:lytic murein transglycosylase [Roseivivax sp. CAU 1761]